MSAGEHHAAAVNERGELFAWGCNRDGQCGLRLPPSQGDEDDPERAAVPINPFKEFHKCLVTLVACGGSHTLALSSTQQVFAWGNNKHGQLGLSHDEADSFNVPQEVCTFKEKIVSWISAGSNHSVALTIEGYCYTWGRNNAGQLGSAGYMEAKPDTKQRVPRIVDSILGVGVA